MIAAQPARTADWLRLVLNSTGEGFYTINRDGETTLCNAAFLRMLGFAGEQDALGRKLHDVIHHTHPHGGSYAKTDCPIYRCAQDGTPADVADETFFRLDGTALPVEYSVRPIIFDGVLEGAICTFVDATDRRAADALLRAAVADRDTLLNEVNHRVKNSLQLAMALLSLQARGLKAGDAKRGIDDALARIAVVAAVHQELYTSGDHESVDIADYLSRLVHNSLRAFTTEGKVELTLDLTAGLRVGIDRAVPLALIVCETVTNSMKYAFQPETKGKIALAVGQKAELVEIRICDDGCGLPEGFDVKRPGGLGTQIITALSRQIRAEVRYERRDPGTCFHIAMPADLPKMAI